MVLRNAIRRTAKRPIQRWVDSSHNIALSSAIQLIEIVGEDLAKLCASNLHIVADRSDIREAHAPCVPPELRRSFNRTSASFLPSVLSDAIAAKCSSRGRALALSQL